MSFVLTPLPPAVDLETRAVLRKVAAAHRYLAELKGVAATIPNESILINTLALQEAKDSSAVENIITTHDDLFRAELFTDMLTSPATKDRYIIQNKAGYYERLQAVRDRQDWEGWLLYMLAGVEQTARQTIVLIQAIRDLMQQYKHNLRTRLPKLYSQDLLNNLFRHPYTKIDFLMNDLHVTRLTATRYLELLTEQGFVHKQKIGRSNYYVNQPLMKLFIEVGNTMPTVPAPMIRTTSDL